LIAATAASRCHSHPRTSPEFAANPIGVPIDPAKIVGPAWQARRYAMHQAPNQGDTEGDI